MMQKGGLNSHVSCFRPKTLISLLARQLKRHPVIAGYRSSVCSAVSHGAVGASMEHEEAVQRLVARIHGNSSKAVVCVTGGAVQSVAWLLSVPGASNTVLECSVPYARDSLVDLLGEEPEQYCSLQTARDMAVAAYKRAAQLSGFGSKVVGLAATCALATVPPKRGDHRAYLACHDGAQGTHICTITFSKGARTRSQEDQLASMALIELLAKVTGEDTTSFHLPLITTSSSSTGTASQTNTSPQAGHGEQQAQSTSLQPDIMQHSHIEDEDPLEALVHGRIRCVEFSHGQVTVDAPRRNKVYLPGSFNPLHRGHIELLKAATKACGKDQQEAAFELSVGNADKGFLPLSDIRKRVKQFTDAGLTVVVTVAPLFINKAELFPGSTLVVGYDTAIRLVMPKYYGDSELNMLLELDRLRQAGCRFMVAGRKDKDNGGFMTLADVAVPATLADLFQGMPEDQFRVDLSSTELRKQQQGEVV